MQEKAKRAKEMKDISEKYAQTDKQRLLQDFYDWGRTLSITEYVKLLLDNSTVKFRAKNEKKYLGVSSSSAVTLTTWSSWAKYTRRVKSKAFESSVIGDVFNVITKGSPAGSFTLRDSTAMSKVNMFDITLNYPDHNIDSPIATMVSFTVNNAGANIDPHWTYSLEQYKIGHLEWQPDITKKPAFRNIPFTTFRGRLPGPDVFDNLCAPMPIILGVRNLSEYGWVRSDSPGLGVMSPSESTNLIEFVTFGHWKEVLAKFLKYRPQWKRYCCITANNDSFIRRVLCGDGNDYVTGNSKCDGVMFDYCGLDASKDDPACGCYDGYMIKDDKERQIFQAVVNQVPNLHRVCMLSECNTADAYKNKVNRDVKCPNTCIQVKNVILGNFAHSEDNSTMEMKCGGNPITNYVECGDCLNGATCKVDNNTVTCACIGGFTGRTCAIPPPAPKQASDLGSSPNPSSASPSSASSLPIPSSASPSSASPSSASSLPSPSSASPSSASPSASITKKDRIRLIVGKILIGCIMLFIGILCTAIVWGALTTDKGVSSIKNKSKSNISKI